MSVCVQALPSSEGAVLSEWTQPRVGSQLSSVQTSWSSQSSEAPRTQVWFTQASRPSQMSPLSQSPSLVQQPGMASFTHPEAGSQKSFVQGAPSSQASEVPGWQPLAESQVSTPSQRLPLSQWACVLQQPPIGLKEHSPVAWSQLSTVQISPSSQGTGMPAWHSPVESLQVSTPLHASLSSHWAFELQQPSIGVLLHASVATLQASLVQTTPSSQLGGSPFTPRPVLGSHVSGPSQKTPSSQTTGCPMQLPPLQVSSVVQLLSSSQGAVLGLLTQLPVSRSQLSSVQTLPSSQFGGGPPAQLPFLQASSVVQALAALQVVPVGFVGVEHVPLVGSQVPAV